MKRTRKPARTPKLRTLYPMLQPYRRGRLRVSELHDLYFEGRESVLQPEAPARRSAGQRTA